MDIEKLKALALAATPGSRRWWPARDGDHDYAQIAAWREHIAQVRIRSITEADINLFLATDPAAVLDLIAEVERLTVENANLQYAFSMAKGSAPAAGTVKDAERLKAAIIAALESNTTEMEGYSYFGSNPGVPEDRYDDVANEVVAAIGAHASTGKG